MKPVAIPLTFSQRRQAAIKRLCSEILYDPSAPASVREDAARTLRDIATPTDYNRLTQRERAVQRSLTAVAAGKPTMPEGVAEIWCTCTQVPDCTCMDCTSHRDMHPERDSICTRCGRRLSKNSTDGVAESVPPAEKP